MPPRVLILSASVGAGHLRAAQAIERALRETAPDALVENVDVLALTNVVFRRIYGKFYLDLVNHAPHVLGYLYDWMDRPRRPKYPPDRLRLILEKLNLRKLAGYLADENWDVIVNTHFLPAEIIAAMRNKGVIHTPQVTVTTDFDTHRMWVNQPCEQYTTATSEGAAYLQSYGVPPEHTHVTGIPIDPVFAKPKDRHQLIREYGFADDRPTVLQLTGGFGVGPVASILSSILAIERPLQVITVAGKNPKAKRQLDLVAVPRRHKCSVFGYTDKIDELMAVADVVVSKPGGLTTSEVLARGATLAILNPIPGQEIRNSDYLLELGAAIKINSVQTLPLKLGGLLNNEKRLHDLKAVCRKIARPRAAYDVAEIALKTARRGGRV
ncbi:MAG TPA: glycosyltransferase [Tepidisphaeraceae bacterium]|nr:glycosyltransferase [Tepidisphaeraceae bacterium]